MIFEILEETKYYLEATIYFIVKIVVPNLLNVGTTNLEACKRKLGQLMQRFFTISDPGYV